MGKCPVCSKKIGLATSFECKCGSTLCARCRMPEDHACPVNYRDLGKRVLEKENPVVVAAKIVKF